jgi:tetratricopeptide (TPR) repeat protein
MTNIKYILSLSIIFLLSSCSDFLDLEPETSLSSAVAFDNIEGIEAGINGAYSIIHSDWVERQYIFAECLMSSVKQVNALSNSNYTQALTHENWSDLFNISGYFWQMSYRTIDVSNQIIRAIPSINADNDQTAADKVRLEGEAYFLRGLMYFGLNRFFAQPQNGLSVPILTAPYQPDQFPFRASIEETKAQVIADLEQAESLMQNIESNDGRATIWSVRGMLARAYFEFKDYQKAQEYANLVIESGRFSLNDGQVGAAYSTEISSENIFTFLSAANDRAANNLYERFSINNANVQLSLSADFWNQINQEPTDLRISELHTDLGGGVACHKYDVRNMNIPFLRLPEMYLIRAESKVENNDLDGGLMDLNRLRQRAGLAATNYVNQSDLLEKIFHNRTVEMSMEGQNFHNLKRLERPIGGYPWEEAKFKLVFFIPLKEIQLNPNLIQNEIW